MKNLRLDDLYKMTAYIYGDRNSVRSKEATFAHFVEVCGMLTVHDRKKKREKFDLTDALCKALGWYFPLLAKLRVESAEALIFRKFPLVCPYCRLAPHQEAQCKQVKGTDKTLNHAEVVKAFDRNWQNRPAGLNEWQAMFSSIYPRAISDEGRSSLGLMEELGELSEAIRVFDVHPQYFLGEAADTFSYLMGLANEHQMRLAQSDATFSFEEEFLRRYPGLCMQCGSRICACPAVPQATIGRMAKELAIAPGEKPFILNPVVFADEGKIAAEAAFENVGGYAGLAEHLPFDRGDANQALVRFCLKLAETIEGTNPSLSATLRAEAIRLSEAAKDAGTASGKLDVGELLTKLRQEWKTLDDDSKKSIVSSGGLVEHIGEMFDSIKVLCVLPNADSGDGFLNLHEEQRAINQAIKSNPNGRKISIESLPAARINDLRTELLKHDYEIIHFSGHANESHLAFQADAGGLEEVSISSVAQMISMYHGVKCVILNACESSKALTTPISPITIGMDKTIEDRAAIEFSRGFYDALSVGKPIERAFEEGVSAVNLAGLDASGIRLIK